MPDALSQGPGDGDALRFLPRRANPWEGAIAGLGMIGLLAALRLAGVGWFVATGLLGAHLSGREARGD